MYEGRGRLRSMEHTVSDGRDLPSSSLSHWLLKTEQSGRVAPEKREVLLSHSCVE